ncbi:MAG TPA: hypothetical protein DD490_23210 [Acidobacteria bacterium]|nr:hypothetical protein [Acidobacteriota bacterium]
MPQEVVVVPAPQAAPAPPPPPPAPEPSIMASQEAADSLLEKAAAPAGVAGGAAAAEEARIAPHAEGSRAGLPGGPHLRWLRVEAGVKVRFMAAAVARWRPLGDNLYEVELTPQAAAAPATKIADLSGAGAGAVRVSDLAGAWEGTSIDFRLATLAAALADSPSAAQREQLLLLARQLAAETAGQPAGAVAAELVRQVEKAKP